ncbi:hypothetical protein [Streptomyces sp. NRRL F-4474]|uniref:hypothetical protein n=1 Tax=Streptomyces sp. NRRL F-4474 TaxID=1463851 RepID=UPI0004C506C9|nr:hypothetical protein [Streptomyces sp. NRRL F-4474]
MAFASASIARFSAALMSSWALPNAAQSPACLAFSASSIAFWASARAALTVGSTLVGGVTVPSPGGWAGGTGVVGASAPKTTFSAFSRVSSKAVWFP